jgi:two-component system KDP operon response regulator KdpE
VSTIVVVEDSVTLGNLLTTTLNRAGHHAVWAPTAASAVRESAAIHPDVVLIDLHLDDGSGADLAVELRDAAGDARLVAMSGDAPGADVESLFDTFLLKPVALEVLLRCVDR